MRRIQGAGLRQEDPQLRVPRRGQGRQVGQTGLPLTMRWGGKKGAVMGLVFGVLVDGLWGRFFAL